jgi:hypothetical protein
MPIKDKLEYNAYMKKYLPEYRKMERELLTKAKSKYGWVTPRQKHSKKVLRNQDGCI